MAFKMRHSVSLIIGALLILSMVHLAQAASLNSWAIEVALNDDGSADWQVILNYKEAVTRDDYWVFGEVHGVSVTVDGAAVTCSITKPELGTSILCDKINGSLIVYSFRMSDAVGRRGDFRQFRYTFPLTQLTDRFALKISLPLGNALVDADKLAGTGIAPFEPAYGKQGSDGRRIFVTWELQNPKLGETIAAAVIYEPISGQAELPLIFAAVAIVAIVAGALTYLFYFRRQPEHLLPALMPAERSIMELVIKQHGIDQSDVVRSTGFSKAKVSRIVQTLVDRRLVEAVPKGRTRELRLAPQPALKESIWSKLFRFKIGKHVEKLELNRAQALELIQTTVTPLIDWLDDVIERLQRHKYGYAWNGNDFEIDRRFANPVPNTLIKEVARMLPSTNARLKAYEENVEKLVKILHKMERGILDNRDFVNTCKRLARTRGSEANERDFVRHIIDRDQVVRTEHAWAQIWNSNTAMLLRAAESRPVKNLRPGLASATQSLLRTCAAFRRELDHLRDHLRQEHHLLFRELRS